MASIIVLVIAGLLAVGVREISSSKDAMRSIATGFMRVLDECKEELNLNEPILTKLFHYWKLDFSLLNRNTGCAILCMSKKLDLIDSEGKLHHGKAQDFAVKHGAAEDVASKLVILIHGCEKQSEGETDDCLRVLEVAKCFRIGVHELNWSPKMDILVDEVLTEI